MGGMDMAADKQSWPTLKIAAGVFFGIMASLLVYSVPGWIRQHEEEQRDNEKLQRELWIDDMKPEKFLTRCGKLLKDESFHETSNSPSGKVVESSRLLVRNVTVEVTTVYDKKENLTASYINMAGDGE